jgi:hypothetical protein
MRNLVLVKMHTTWNNLIIFFDYFRCLVVTTRYQRKERPAETLEQKECHAEIKGLSHWKLYFKVDSLKGQVFLNSVKGTVQRDGSDWK